MDVRSVHHVAFAVEDLDAAVETYRSLFGAEVEVRGRMEEQGVEAVYLRLGTGRVELVAPLGAGHPRRAVPGEAGAPACTTSPIAVADVAAASASSPRTGVEVIDPGLGRVSAATSSRSSIPIRFTAFSRR